MFVVTIKTSDQEFTIKAGDTVDFGRHGLLVFFAEPEATAQRILQGEHQRTVNEVIAFVEKRCEQGNSEKPSH